MTELQDTWARYTVIEKSGVGRTPECYELEEKIHAIQKKAGLPPYDFDNRWLNKQIRGKPTVSGPAFEKPTVDGETPANYIKLTDQMSIEEIKKKIGENNANLYEYFLREAHMLLTYLTAVANTLDPSYSNNPAKRGQLINIGLNMYRMHKESGEEKPNAST